MRHRNRVYDWVDQGYRCSFCGKFWSKDDDEPDCISGHEKTMMIRKTLDERTASESDNSLPHTGD